MLETLEERNGMKKRKLFPPKITVIIVVRAREIRNTSFSRHFDLLHS